ncbi:dihydrolipoyl dehydrogenase [Gordonibacter sp.]|uniref:dihydrolipoyl dehydrogenase n=1 Tax=Gordonibacter sp. TaxID=1968902 RepID=UPI002FCB9CE4
MQDRYNLIVVGAGPGGYVAAIKAAQLGLSVALVERDLVGGTCLNRGCIPTKTLLHTAELFGEIIRGEALGLHVEGARIDFPALRQRMGEVCGTMRNGVIGLLDANGIEVVPGNGRIEAPGRVSVTQSDGAIFVLEADDLVVAPGSKPALPPIPGIDLPGVLTSDELLAQVPEFGRIAIIGGGVIGAEFAGFYQALGTEVTVIEAMGRLLPTLDRELGMSLAQLLKKRGGTVAASATVKAIEQGPAGSLVVRYEAKEALHAVEVDGVLVATGRKAVADDLFAPDLGVELVRGRIPVDASMKTAVAHLYAIGDAADAGIQLAHAASAQGIVAVCALTSSTCDVDASTIPSCIYTSPEIASVGLTEAEAKEAGIALKTGKFPLSGNAKTIIADAERSYIKVVAAEDGRILGAQLMCNRATDIVGEFALAITAGLTVEEMARAVRPHPTYEEAVGEALDTLLGGAIHARPLRR